MGLNLLDSFGFMILNYDAMADKSITTYSVYLFI